jgi:subtilase family serine protease
MKHLLACLALSSGIAFGAAGPVSRLHGPIENTETFVLVGHTLQLSQTAHDLGAASSSLALPQLALHFKMSAAQSTDLSNLLVAQRDRKSAWYHKWLTPEQFGARYGVSDGDFRKIKDWLANAGFTDIELSRSRTFVRMSGKVAEANNLFNVAIRHYTHGGQTFYANAANPVFPKALEGMISGLNGLTNDGVRPFVRRKPAPQISVGINGNHFLGPDDFATIYGFRTLYNQGTNGAGQTIAVVGQSDISLSDITAFQTAAGLPLKSPQVILAGVDPGVDPDSAIEADLDLEWTGAVARAATIIYVNSTNALASAVYAIDNDLAPIISISYGLCEAALSSAEMATYNAAFQLANAQGITIVVASGDTGAAACDVDQDATNTPETTAALGLAVSFPASSPYVTAVGGTEFDEAQGSYWDSSGHAQSYIPEITWNDTSAMQILLGSGGGASQGFAKPDWQAGVGVPADGSRDIPDIAFSSSPFHDPYLICAGGSCSNGFTPPVSQLYFVGGTSCAAPVFSAMLALLNQSSKGSQGNINPALYALASFNSGVFHDVQLGDNRVPCVAGTTGCQGGALGYTAGPGYDQVTGLGSVDATQLIEQWGSDFQLTPTPASLSFSSGATATTGIQLQRFANFTGSVSFTCAVASSLTNTICSVPASVSGSSVVTLTVTNTSTAGFGYWFRSVPPIWFIFLLVVISAFFIWPSKRKISFAAPTLCLVVLAGCGSGSSNASVGAGSRTLTGNVTVTATSGILQHVITVPVTIN